MRPFFFDCQGKLQSAAAGNRAYKGKKDWGGPSTLFAVHIASLPEDETKLK